MIRKLSELVDEVKKESTKNLVVACGEDPHTIEAVGRGVSEGVVKATLIGNRTKIEKVAAEHKVPIDSFEIENESDTKKALIKSVELVRDGKGDALMKGLIDTSLYMRAILDKERGLLPPKRVLSHITVLEFPTYPRLLIVSDVAVIPYPDLFQKIEMVKYTIEVAHLLGISRPKVAIICAVEKVNPKMQPTLDAAVISKMADRGQIKGAEIDGPLAMDVAVSKESADIKGLKSSVAGSADILIFPNIESGNVFFKTGTRLSNAKLAAVVAGTTKPCILTSRGDSGESKFYSIALAAKLSRSS